MFKKKWPQRVAKWLGQSNDELKCPQVISREQHCVSRKHISDSALKVLYRLHKHGFSAYLVGGGVRDLLLQRASKDFDIATNATPEQLRELFINSRIIGRRFRIVHVVFQEEIVEVTTFRAATQDKPNANVSRLRHENTFGTLEEDAWRRDFTINALYYDISDFSIIDHTGGMADLDQQTLRMIGDPFTRFQEDPVRMLRAIRFAAKLQFQLEPAVEKNVQQLSNLLLQVPSSRLLLEFEKLFFSGFALDTFNALEKYDYIQLLFPELGQMLVRSKVDPSRELIIAALQSTDQRFRQGLFLSSGFFFSVLLWPVLCARLERTRDQYSHFYAALHASIIETIQQQRTIISLPKRHAHMIRSIWVLQFSLERRRPKRVKSLLRHRYFRAALDLLELRAQIDSNLQSLADWWRMLEDADQDAIDVMIKNIEKKGS